MTDVHGNKVRCNTRRVWMGVRPIHDQRMTASTAGTTHQINILSGRLQSCLSLIAISQLSSKLSALKHSTIHYWNNNEPLDQTTVHGSCHMKIEAMPSNQ